jgi:hypothetical protein
MKNNFGWSKTGSKRVANILCQFICSKSKADKTVLWLLIVWERIDEKWCKGSFFSYGKYNILIGVTTFFIKIHLVINLRYIDFPTSKFCLKYCYHIAYM